MKTFTLVFCPFVVIYGKTLGARITEVNRYDGGLLITMLDLSDGNMGTEAVFIVPLPYPCSHPWGKQPFH